MPNQYFLGVDIGTYSSKGVLVEAVSGDVVAEQSIEHGLEMPKPGWAEHDADAVWWEEFARICQSLLSKSHVKAEDVKSVGISALGACVLPVDTAGKPLRKAILYGIDTRAMAEIEELERVFTPEKIFQISGMKLSAQSTGPKILWIKNHEPQIYKETRFFLTSQAYLVYRLTGKATLDIFTMADYTPMGDIRNNRWSRETTEYIAPLDKLPEPTWSCNIAGYVTKEASRKTSLAVGTPVIVGTTDAGAEAVSTGIGQPGDLMIMFGSTIFIIMLADRLMPSPRLWATAWLDPTAYTLQGGTSTSGSLTRWFRDNLSPLEVAAQKAGGEPAYAALGRLLKDSLPGAKGLISLPYFEGERTPIYDSEAKGLLLGLTLSHTRADIYRSLLEGIAFGIRHMIDTMLEEGAKPRRIIGASGGTKNREWMQIVSDIANIEMTILEQDSSASYGDAFMAGVGVGYYQNLKESSKWVRKVTSVKPNPVNTQIYEPYYRIFRRLYEQSKDLMHELDALQRQ
ncbi:MAG: FGGY-family carbohydrate kinase [Anaerolineaceae bacterium]|nr:FGGY-family carbohydrate kinase [Anaerolineaceae bacterium]